ncbi:unnamed protein product [Darwinula stevensoni]|uniref:Sodium/calcium exchanger membrane region domain-containing protein n=1 Tax=Darwinula stevensoni TaxID=69355 RepID=A0A7R8XI76_9CRUS|nr:unnamed protein product [Darwinula stevensoni]CAG0893582.1 unnamed protein product [Darwinula stevensoni]
MKGAARRSALFRVSSSCILFSLVFLFYWFFLGPDESLDGEAAVRSRHLLSQGENCTDPAIEEFPDDFLSFSQKRKGGIVIHFLIAIYLFLGIAIVCDEYFVPSLDVICNELGMSTDVAGASFMAAGTSSPELFTNLLATFITEGDVGLATIVGSAVFNILGVVTLCGLFAGLVLRVSMQVIPVDFWPLSRDCLAYGVSVILLIIVINDEIVTWWEALMLFAAYFIYVVGKSFPDPFLFSFFFHSLSYDPFPHLKTSEWGWKVSIPHPEDDPERATPASNGESATPVSNGEPAPPVSNGEPAPTLPSNSLKEEENSESSAVCGGWCPPGLEGGSNLWRIYWFITWPFRFPMFLTIPDCRRKRWRKFYLPAFFSCLIWIGGLSYLVVWMITVIGHTIGVPDTVMGLTFLAIGTSIPEVVSSLIVARQGHGTMSVSNAVGSNTFDILVCLGLPWLIKSSFFPSNPGTKSIDIKSEGITYSTIALLSTLVLMYLVMVLNRFVLNRRVGFYCCLLYILFLVFSLLWELNVFGVVNLPTCPS